jgi:N-acetylmuramoyl-L-alanine amidase
MKRQRGAVRDKKSDAIRPMTSKPARIVIGALAATLLSLGGAALALGELARAPSRKSDRATCDRAQFRVVVDVGHSAESPGAFSSRGVPEYDFNLALARHIGQQLTQAGFRKSLVLITPGPKRAGLFARVARANRWPADLFLSVHHDSVPERFLEAWVHDGVAGTFSDRFAGHSLFISAANAEPEASFLFAQLLGQELKDRGLRYAAHYAEAYMAERRRDLLDPDRGVYRYDELVVLRETAMPAVLLEAGSIINRGEELVMGTEQRRSEIGSAVTHAVELFCSSRRRVPTSKAPGPETPLRDARAGQGKP